MPIVASPVEAVAVLGFVLAGIPVYYATQANEEDLPRVLCRLLLYPLHWITAELTGTIACFRSYVARLRGRTLEEEGWEAVAMEGDDEPMRMEERAHGR